MATLLQTLQYVPKLHSISIMISLKKWKSAAGFDLDSLMGEHG
jgi:hypothetical protein